MDRIIYCDKCNFQYNLFAKKESLCSGKTLNTTLKYLMFMCGINLFAVFFLIADGLMKTRRAHEDLLKDQNELEEKKGPLPPGQQPIYDDEGWFDNRDAQDYSVPFSFASSVLWNDLLYLEGLVLTLMGWCFYFQTNRALQVRKKLIYIIV